MYYIYYRIKCLFKKYKIPLEIYAIKNVTYWMTYSLQYYPSDEQMRMRANYRHLMPGLQALRGWLQSRYEQEVNFEYCQLNDLGGDIDQLDMSRELAHKQPGNEVLYKLEEQAPTKAHLIPSRAEGNTEI